MKYAIIANPAAGPLPPHKKYVVLSHPARILRSAIFGLDTSSPDEFTDVARQLAKDMDVLVVAGGDGTFSDIINAVDLSGVILAYLPLGTGNAFKYALSYKGRLNELSRRIKTAPVRALDLVDCDSKRKGYMVSAGLEGEVIRLRDQYESRGSSGIKTYGRAVFQAYFRHFKRNSAKIVTDETTISAENILSIMVMKQPYYGAGMQIMPRAKFDDGLLHMKIINSGLAKSVLSGLGSFLSGSELGDYRTAKKMTVHFEHPLWLQIDGNSGWHSKTFCFSVLSQCLWIKY